MSRSRSGLQGLGEYGSKPESLSRPLTGVCSGYRHHAYTSRRGSRHGSALLLLRLGPLHRAGLGHGLNRLWLAALRGGFFIGRPFGEFGPAVTVVELGVCRRHFDRAIEADNDVLAGGGL